jgi:hypothetical protein
MRKFEVIFPDNTAIFTEAPSLLGAKQYASRIARHFFAMNPRETLFLLDRTREELYRKKGKNGTWMRDYDEHPVGLWQYAKKEVRV